MSLKVSSAPIGTMFCVIGRGTCQSRSTSMTHLLPLPPSPLLFPMAGYRLKTLFTWPNVSSLETERTILGFGHPSFHTFWEICFCCLYHLACDVFFFSATLFPLRCAKRSVSERPAKPVVVLGRIPAKTVFTFPLLIRSIAELGDDGGQLLSGLECCLKVSTLSEGSRSHWTTLSKFWLAKAIPMFSIQFLVSQPEKYE